MFVDQRKMMLLKPKEWLSKALSDIHAAEAARIRQEEPERLHQTRQKAE